MEMCHDKFPNFYFWRRMSGGIWYDIRSYPVTYNKFFDTIYLSVWAGWTPGLIYCRNYLLGTSYINNVEPVDRNRAYCPSFLIYFVFWTDFLLVAHAVHTVLGILYSSWSNILDVFCGTWHHLRCWTCVYVQTFQSGQIWTYLYKGGQPTAIQGEFAAAASRSVNSTIANLYM